MTCNIKTFVSSERDTFWASHTGFSVLATYVLPPRLRTYTVSVGRYSHYILGWRSFGLTSTRPGLLSHEGPWNQIDQLSPTCRAVQHGLGSLAPVHRWPTSIRTGQLDPYSDFTLHIHFRGHAKPSASSIIHLQHDRSHKFIRLHSEVIHLPSRYKCVDLTR